MDGKLLGITPLSVSVPIGAHTLTLTNPKEKLTRTQKVTIKEGASESVRVDLRRP
jgi:hypothetical protein